MLAFDHVVIAVESFESAAQALRVTTGLEARPGGRHAGHGTGNWIAPLGSTYLELMSAVDAEEAAASVLGRAVLSAADRNAVFALCLRTDDISAVADRLGLTAMAMSRVTPDGEELRWRLAGLENAMSDGLPFFIQWDTDVHPGAGGDVAGLMTWIEVGADPATLDAWLGESSLDI
ncbi:MAG: VOC family protein, partial [Jiangellaceae bacterium]